MAETAARVLRFAGPVGLEKQLPKSNPWIGSELDERLDDFYLTVNEERKRNRFGRDRVKDQFKLQIVTAIARKKIKSWGEMYDFIKHLEKEAGQKIELRELFEGEGERKKLLDIFSSYESLIKRGVIKIPKAQTADEENAHARRKAA